MPVVWTGDFNSEPRTNAFALLTNATASGAACYMRDAWPMSALVRFDTNQSPMPPYDYSDAIDHIFSAAKTGTSTPEVGPDVPSS
jgi:endonuclease/exonuclease/phosphatase family metal-dependent hydrolase